MQQTRSVELGTGLFVLLGLAALFFLTTQTTGSSDISTSDAYEVTARFENVGSLKDRAPVSMSGVTIGRVTKVEFDPRGLDAVVTFVIVLPPWPTSTVPSNTRVTLAPLFNVPIDQTPVVAL